MPELATSWKPRQGARCRIIPNAQEEKVADRGGCPDIPPGIWWCLEQAPTNGHWWLVPHDDDAKEWAAQPTHGRYISRHQMHLRPAVG